MSKPQFRAAMQTRKDEITKQKKNARDDIGDALEDYFLNAEMNLTRLDAFTKNQFRAQFKEADDEETLTEAMDMLADQVPALRQMLDSSAYTLDTEGCINYMSDLYDAENIMGLLKIPAGMSGMADKILEAMNSTQLGISLNENTEQFVMAEDFELPEYEGDVVSSANSYKIRVGLGTVAYLLLPYVQEQIRGNLNIDGENATISITTNVEQTIEVPSETNPGEFESFQETWPLEVVIKFYREPETEENPEPLNVMTISGGGNSLHAIQVRQEFNHVVNQIINETNVGVCIVKEQVF